jgi:hypothetical protein
MVDEGKVASLDDVVTADLMDDASVSWTDGAV